MPCDDTGYSKDRAMNPAEQWNSFTRHHTVLEKETEMLRAWCEWAKSAMADVRKMFPAIALREGEPQFPGVTPPWRPKPIGS